MPFDRNVLGIVVTGVCFGYVYRFRTAVFRTSDPQHKQLACSKAGKHREDSRVKRKAGDAEVCAQLVKRFAT